MWSAWNDYKGMSLDQARRKFIEIVEPILVAHGFEIRDPAAPGPNYYEECGNNTLVKAKPSEDELANSKPK